MAHLVRLVLALWWLAFLPSATAAAAFPMPKLYAYEGNGFSSAFVHSSAQAACAAWLGRHSESGTTYSMTSVTESNCLAKATSNGVARIISASVYSNSADRCPDNSVLVPGTNTCTCDPGYVEEGGQCKYTSTGNSCNGLSDFCSGLKGQKINLEGKGTASPPGCAADTARPNCAMGCAGEEVGIGVSYKNSDGDWMTGQEYRVTGGTCTLPQPSDIPQKKESDCAGSVGEVNGVRTCIPNKAAMGDTSMKETKNSDGTSSNTETKTTCEKGVCTTTSTTTNKDASGATASTSTSSSSSSQSTYCASNKSSSVCAATNGDKNPDGKDGEGDGKCEGDDCEDKPGKFEGSCAGGFTCEGDAISCSISKEIHTRNCQMDALKDGDLYKAWEAVKDFGTKNVTTDLPGNKRIDISILDRDDFLNAGSCPADRVIDIGRFGSISLPFSRLCPWLEILGYINVVVTSIVGASIVIRRQS
ncbi:virulence factor TspB C-terminal domain-related protein [Comamonas sp. lk]|uniref:virulence factor TspB C-terminal domain-related protein n=1 Tax=Comamonas sp. lk TaxID=2201272 RepID=UPI0013CEA4D8|nr:virulence factor TspB C-terminal domain-related protein [Comamonas sp. lk]